MNCKPKKNKTETHIIYYYKYNERIYIRHTFQDTLEKGNKNDKILSQLYISREKDPLLVEIVINNNIKPIFLKYIEIKKDLDGDEKFKLICDEVRKAIDEFGFNPCFLLNEEISIFNYSEDIIKKHNFFLKTSYPGYYDEDFDDYYSGLTKSYADYFDEDYLKKKKESYPLYIKKILKKKKKTL